MYKWSHISYVFSWVRAYGIDSQWCSITIATQPLPIHENAICISVQWRIRWIYFDNKLDECCWNCANMILIYCLYGANMKMLNEWPEMAFSNSVGFETVWIFVTYFLNFRFISSMKSQIFMPRSLTWRRIFESLQRTMTILLFCHTPFHSLYTTRTISIVIIFLLLFFPVHSQVVHLSVHEEDCTCTFVIHVQLKFHSSNAIHECLNTQMKWMQIAEEEKNTKTQRIQYFSFPHNYQPHFVCTQCLGLRGYEIDGGKHSIDRAMQCNAMQYYHEILVCFTFFLLFLYWLHSLRAFQQFCV